MIRLLLFLFQAVTSVVMAFGLSYFIAAMVPGVVFSRTEQRKGRARRGRRALDRAGRADSQMDVYFLIGCLNEESVIGRTVSALREQVPHARIVVVDDGSDDATAQAVRSAGDAGVSIVTRVLPNARKGKGEALNDGYQWILKDVDRRGLDPDDTLVCVMDADGQLSNGAFVHVTALFSDRAVGGVQLPVRIRNRSQLITRIQDLEFWGLSATSQFGRNYSRSVSLGGNAQFTRLSALTGLGRPPWNASLTEDLELAVSLSIDGWALQTTSRAWVTQEAVDSWGRLVRQRTRWFQGHMMAGRNIPKLWSAPHVSNLAALEITLYLLVPWALTLPWSVIFHVALVMMVTQLATGNEIGFIQFGGSVSQLAFTSAVYYFLSFFPMHMAGYFYYRRDRGFGIFKSLLLGHTLLIANYVAYAAAWRAVGRMILGRNGWAKTARTAGESLGLTAEKTHELPPAATVGTPALTPVPAGARRFDGAETFQPRAVLPPAPHA
ncbi:glycosyltransferase [Streptomyces sp. IBSNAI002]|uniref:glycosyltransferase n=1 Tax=Streptomyces sp. IBSNAI002 TaxID=3457500 RepID=UPI003FD6AC10